MTVALVEELARTLIEALATEDPTRRWNMINRDASGLFDKLKNKAWQEWVSQMNRERKGRK